MNIVEKIDAMLKLGTKEKPAEEKEEEVIEEAGMTKVHFESLAKMMKAHKNKKDLADQIVNWLKDQNPLFDEGRFRKASGM